MLNIKWYGHSMWEVTIDKKKILYDPFGDIGYPLPSIEAVDIVISSHEHANHSNFKSLQKLVFKKINQIGTYYVDNVTVRLIEVSHGRFEGKKLGDTFISVMTVAGLSIVHCGDIGVMPTESVLFDIATPDVLFIPVGGSYTIDAAVAGEIIKVVKPKNVFPMHYKTDVLTIENIEGIAPFLKLFPKTKIIEADNVTLTKKDFNTEKTQIFKLDYPQRASSGNENI
ncbi:MAG: MBL fold metallo-hydrolase [Candidatus Cloacimonetes bacterium]|nr:MBL fold metallo-hydrolase [Candidatus Cloacimonadota bacterium]